MATQAEPGGWTAVAIDLTRAAAGGLLIGVPLLFTMEMWAIGTHTEPLQIAGLLALTFFVLLALNRTLGFRSRADTTLADALVDTVIALAVALVLVAGVLALLGEIDADTRMRHALGKVANQVLPFSLGIGVARHFLRQDRAESDEGDEPGLSPTVADVGATVVGAMAVALSIAPTDEVGVLAGQLEGARLLAVIGVSLVTSYGIVFVAGFVNQGRRFAQRGVIQHPVTETVVCYLVALVVSGALLALFQRLDGSPGHRLTAVVVLGLPAAVGGAAGRLAV
jgi:putative integral membrane protein (TIGR02587 family)